MTQTQTRPARTAPVMVTIGRRPTETAIATLPVPITPEPIADDEFRVLTDLDADVLRVHACSCSSGDDLPY